MNAVNGSCPGTPHVPPKPARPPRRRLPWQRAAVLFELVAIAAALVTVAISLAAVAAGQW